MFVVTAAANVALSMLGAPMGFGVGPFFALYFLALMPATTLRERWLTATIVAGAFVVLAYTDRLDNSYTPEFVGVPFWVGVWVFGDWMRLRRERMAEHEERSLRAEREAERERRLAVAEAHSHRSRSTRLGRTRDQRDTRSGRRCTVALRARSCACPSGARDDRRGGA
ncbi:hypothetical protein BH18ACT16_BH18ACT16_12490 [soil metagenome]